MSRTSKALLRLGVPGLAAVTLVAGIPAFLGTAQAAPINSLTIAPVDGQDSGAAGSCQAYIVTGQASATNTSTVGETVNVVLTDNTGSASSDVSFCTAPTTVGSTTYTPAAGTVVSAGGAQTGGGSVDQSRFTLGSGTTAAPNNGTVIIGLTRNNPTTPANSANGLTGNVNIQVYSDQNGNNTFNAGEPQANRTTAFTAGGPAGSNANQDAVTRVEVIDGGETATATADADTDTALAGEQRSFTVGANNGIDPVAGATVSFSINSSVDTGDRGTAVFGVTNNDGTVTGNITFPTGPATDTVTFFVNQSGASSTPNLDPSEPRDTVTVDVQANTAQQNRAVALTALPDAGAGLNTQSGSSAVNVTTDKTRTFRATVTDTRSTGASASTAGVLLSFAVTGGSGDEDVTTAQQTPGGFTNECTTVNETGTATPTNDSFCDITVTDPTPTNGQTLTITATVRGTSATGTGTLRFRAAPNQARNIAVTPDSGETLTQNVRQFTATVTDVNGRPVEGVVVDFSESGPGFIRGATSVTTGVNGTAVVETTTAAGETGTETVTGTVNASQTDENGAASTPQTGRAAGDPAGSTAGNRSDTGTTTWVTTLSSPSPSASTPASPSPSATSTVSPSPSSSQASRLGISVSPATITPGVASVVTVTGTPGTIIELQAYSRPNTTYGVVRRGTILENGTIVFRVLPGTNTRLFAAVTGQTGNESPSVVINVKTALSLTVVRNGSRDYTFQGRILPRRAGQLITLYRVLNDGREIITSQIRTDNSGTYRIRRVFTGSGVFGFLTRTGQTLTNAAGESNNGQARPTAIYAGPQR